MHDDASPFPPGPQQVPASGADDLSGVPDVTAWALDAFAIGVWTHDPRTDQVALSPRARAMFGLGTDARCDWQHLLALINADDRERVHAARAVSCDPVGPGHATVEFRIRRPDGSLLRVECRTAAQVQVTVSGCQVPHLHGAMRELSAPTRPNASQPDGEALYRALAANLPGGAAFVIDHDLCYQLAEGQALASAGMCSADLEGKTIYEALDPVLARTYEPLYRQALAGQPFRWEHRSHGRDYVSHGVPLYDDTGAVYAALAVSYDITERTLAEAALKESQHFLQRLTSTIPNIIYVYDVQTQRYVYANRQLWDVLGYLPEHAQALGDRFLPTVIHPDDWAVTPAHFARLQALGDGEVLEREYRMQHASGAWRWFWGHEMVFARDVASHPTQVLGSVLDITERTEAQAAVAQAFAAEQAARAEAEAALQTREQFLAIASHELRTPLTSLLGYAHLVQRGVRAGTGDAVTAAAKLTQQAQRLTRLIEQLLDVARLQQGQFAIQRQRIDVAALVEQVVDAFRATLPPDAPQVVTLRRPRAPILLAADAERLEQVVLNLLSNAVKYSPDGGVVEVRVSASASELSLEVVDQGIGIPAEAQAHLYEPYYRASNAGAQARGFGLGLHVVREIVQRHGGQLAVESTEGVGSTFRIVLPRQVEES